MLDESRARIILLCAPAGYGKTTLAREWIATRSEPVAWYRGGAEMSDVAAVALARRGIGTRNAARPRGPHCSAGGAKSAPLSPRTLVSNRLVQRRESHFGDRRLPLCASIARLGGAHFVARHQLRATGAPGEQGTTHLVDPKDER